MVPKDSLEGTTTAIPKQYGDTNARANMAHQDADDDCDDRKRGVSDIGSDGTGPDEDSGSDSPLVFEAMKVFKTVQDFGNQLDNPCKIRMAHTVHFDAEDENHTEDEQLTHLTGWLVTSQCLGYTYRLRMMEQTLASWATDGKYWRQQIPKDTPISSDMTKTPQGNDI
jgi:hypothetical protein